MQSSVVENGIKVRYIGQNVGARLIIGGDNRVYRGGNNRLDRIQYLHPDDVELLKDSFEVVESPKAESVNTYSLNIATHEGVTNEQVAAAFANVAPFVNAEAFGVNETAADLNPESLGGRDGQAESKPSRKRGTE